MIENKIKITNTRGLHARAAAKLVKCVESFDAAVSVTHNGMTVTGQSIMGLLMLGAGLGKTITVTAEGREAESALAAVTSLIENKFGENN